MKKKLVSVLLALTLCGSLAVPVFAEPAEELPAPEESEVLTGEEAPILEEPHEHEDSVAFHIADAVWSTEDGIIGITNIGPMLVDDSLVPNYITDSIGGEANLVSTDHTHQFNEVVSRTSYWDTNSSGHRWVVKTVFRCTGAGCGSESIIFDYFPSSGDYMAHSWTKGSATGNQSCTGLIHKVEYNYACSVCNAKKTEWESHGKMVNTGANSSNFHKGTLHYFTDEYVCSCGYTTMHTSSYACPGNEDGVGCIIKFNLGEEEIMEDVTEPEDAALSEDVVLPEDVTTPEDVMDPEETGIPEEITTPEETPEPEEPYE